MDYIILQNFTTKEKANYLIYDILVLNMTPSLNEEKKLWKKGFKFVAGLDEVGRGPLAGPVVAAAVFLIPNSKFIIQNLRDSKKLSPKRRQEIYNILAKNPKVKWGIGKVSEKVIDKINILEATKLAMQKAVANLSCKTDFLILDGNTKINMALPQKAIVKADEKVFSCALASIIAKVSRDRMMKRYAKKFPIYGFEKHKGYGTKKHKETLKKYGFCQIHRQSFNPVKTMVKSLT